MSQSPAVSVSKSAFVASRALSARPSSFRWSPVDAWLLRATLGQMVLLAAAARMAFGAGIFGALAFAAWFGVSIVWGSNTVAHVHVHTPLFRSRLQNEAFCVLLSLWLGVPQTFWRARHLAHHAGQASRPKRHALRARAVVEILAIGALWAALLAFAPRFFLTAYAPGYVLGMALAWLQGHYEHRDESQVGAGVSHYGKLHNLLWCNDGYHVEHHRFPNEHWAALPSRRIAGAAASALPPLFRWLDRPRTKGIATPAGTIAAPAEAPAGSRLNGASARLLGALEKMVLRSPLLQGWVIDCHERAFRAVFAGLGRPSFERICVVGGGLFPRTVVALRRIFPEAHIVVLDGSAENLECARADLSARGLNERVEMLLGRFDPRMDTGAELLIAPLAFEGDRSLLYTAPTASCTVVHDWIWRRKGSVSAVVSLLLFKRMNAVLRSLS